MTNEGHFFYAFDRGLWQPQWMENAAFRVCPAVKDGARGAMMTEGCFETPRRPWEQRWDNAYPNVIYDKERGLYRLYYTLFTTDEDSFGVQREERAKRPYRPTAGRVTSLGYAESRDGVTWRKPDLGLVSWRGSRSNNLVLLHAHGTGVMLDEKDPDPARRYKLLTKVDYPESGHNFLAVGFSGDGLHFGKLQRIENQNPPADSHNFVFRDERDGRYKLITRVWAGGIRVSALMESADFINWTSPREICRGTGFEDQVYSMPVFQSRGMYLGLASIFHEGDRLDESFDTVDLELTYSSSLSHMSDVSKGESFIKRGEGRYPDGAFDSGCVFAAAPVEIDGRLCFYYMGGNGRHTGFRETSLGRAFSEKDKFACLVPKNAGKDMLLSTRPLYFFGEKLALLFDAEEGGAIRCAVFDRAGGAPLAGFDFGDARLSKEKDGWTAVSFAKPLYETKRSGSVMVIEGRGVKLYAAKGDMDIIGSRYYGG